MYCDGGNGDTTCGPTQYELFTDKYVSFTGGAPCATGTLRSLCCDALQTAQECHWTGCSTTVDCDLSKEVSAAVRGDQDSGTPCPDGQYRNYCCPEAPLTGESSVIVIYVQYAGMLTHR